MLVVGERINSTRKRIKPAIAEQDVEIITSEAKMQVEAGATYLDCNAATVGVDREPEVLTWLIETVQSATDDIPCAIDSPNPVAIRAAAAKKLRLFLMIVMVSPYSLVRSACVMG